MTRRYTKHVLQCPWRMRCTGGVTAKWYNVDVIDAETTNEVRYDGRGKPNTLNTHTNRHRHRHLETYTSGEVFIGDVTAATATDATAFTNNHCARWRRWRTVLQVENAFCRTWWWQGESRTLVTYPYCRRTYSTRRSSLHLLLTSTTRDNGHLLMPGTTHTCTRRLTDSDHSDDIVHKQ